MTRLSMIALAAGLSGLATAAMAQQTNLPPPPSGPYQAGQWSPGYDQQRTRRERSLRIATVYVAVERMREALGAGGP